MRTNTDCGQNIVLPIQLAMRPDVGKNNRVAFLFINRANVSGGVDALVAVVLSVKRVIIEERVK